jgi:hypothetical protein
LATAIGFAVRCKENRQGAGLTFALMAHQVAFSTQKTDQRQIRSRFIKVARASLHPYVLMAM